MRRASSVARRSKLSTCCLLCYARIEISRIGSLVGMYRRSQIRHEGQGRIAMREKVATSIDLPLSKECKRILAYAAEEAERLQHRHIGTEHLFLGILRERNSGAAQILNGHGAQLEAIREELARSRNEQE